MAGSDFEYDDSNLRAMIEELDDLNRVKAFKLALRIAGNKVRKRAIANLRQSIHSSAALEKGIKVWVWKRKAGFSVTIGNSFYKSTRFTGKNARAVPVLMWLESGTKKRTMRRKMWSVKGSKSRHATGSLRSYSYMARTLEQETPSVTAYLHESIDKAVKKIAKKYGCK